MAIDVQTWKHLYNVFNPAKRLGYDQQALYVNRPGSVAERIAQVLDLQVEDNGKWVICGSMGSGKSSELVHLAKLLENTHTVVALDLLQSVTTINSIQPSEVLFAIGAGAVQVAQDDIGYDVPDKLVNDFLKAFEGLLRKDRDVDVRQLLLQGVARFANVAAPGSGAVVDGAAKAAVGALDTKTQIGAARLGGLTRPVREGETDFEKLRVTVDNILADLRVQRRLVILVDGLDKIDREESIRDLFATNRILAMPLAQVVYSAPIDLMLGPLWQAAGAVFSRERLTNVLVHRPTVSGIEPQEDEIARGRATMEDVVRRRLQSHGLEIDDAFDPGALDVFVEASGGLLRDLIHLVRRSILATLLNEGSTIGLATAEAALVELRKEFEITLTTQSVEELRHVRKYGEPRGVDKHIRDLFLGGYILPYSNGGSWFEPHPILQRVRQKI